MSLDTLTVRAAAAALDVVSRLCRATQAAAALCSGSPCQTARQPGRAWSAGRGAGRTGSHRTGNPSRGRRRPARWGGVHPPSACLATTRPLPTAALQPRPTCSALASLGSFLALAWLRAHAAQPSLSACQGQAVAESCAAAALDATPHLGDREDGKAGSVGQDGGGDAALRCEGAQLGEAPDDVCRSKNVGLQ